MTVGELLTKYNRLYATCRFDLHDDDPWLPIIGKLSSFLQSNCHEHGQVIVVQVKEKFGGLRFYHNGCDEYLQGAIDFAASLCYDKTRIY